MGDSGLRKHRSEAAGAARNPGDGGGRGTDHPSEVVAIVGLLKEDSSLKSLLSIAIALLVGSSAFAHSGAPSADELLRQINTEGADTVLDRLWSDDAVPSKFSKVCERIESGEPAWLKVAQKLKAVSDAGAAEMLDESVARALPAAPTRVLSLINHGFQLDFICTSPFEEPTPGVAERYQRRAVAALQKPVPSELEQVRKECLEKIQTSLHRESQ